MFVHPFYIDGQETLLGMPMDRNEAVTYLKELLSQCDMSPASVSFENPKESDSVGYRVHNKGAIQESDKQAVRDVAKKQFNRTGRYRWRCRVQV